MRLSDNRHRAFTLVELMISLAIALVLILGIEQVFSITSKTIGGGQALSTAARDDRALHTILSADFQNAVTTSDSPYFIIRSGRIYAFNTVADKAAAMDPTNPQLDPAYVNYPIPNTIPTTDYNYRCHRIDRIGFFERGFFQRQTGGDDGSHTEFLSTTTSNEAFVWLGHLALPNNAYAKWITTTPPRPTQPTSAEFFEPGVPADANGTNDNNSNAADWILGRVAMLLVPSPTDQSYIDAAPTNIPSPLAMGSTSLDGASTIEQSRYDEAKTSIAGMSGTLGTYLPAASTALTFVSSNTPNKDWYEKLFGKAVGTPVSGGAKVATYRFQANPFVGKPLVNSSLAKTAPIFVRSCTQFIVEYAGDFVSQNTDGSVSTNGADGILDFQVVNGQRQIRWYGFPRHTSGNTTTSITPKTDVVPLGSLLAAANLPTASFERYSAGFMPPAGINYTTNDYAASGAVPASAEYVAAWGPDSTEPLPKMIRVTIGIDDPNGNLNNAQMYEYIFNLGQ